MSAADQIEIKFGDLSFQQSQPLVRHVVLQSPALNELQFVKGDLSAGGVRVSGVSQPQDPSDAVNLAYLSSSWLFASVQGNTTPESAPGAIGDVIPIAAGNYVSHMSQNFSITPAGVITYTGADPITVRCEVSISALAAGPAREVYEFLLTIDNVEVAGSKMVCVLDDVFANIWPQNTGITVLLNLVQNNVVRLCFRNNTSTQSMVANYVQIVLDRALF